MKKKNVIIVLIYLGSISQVYPSTEPSFVTTSSTEKSINTIEDVLNLSNQTSNNLEITQMEIHTSVTNRFARTQITSHVKNFANKSREAVFAVVLPETAYISGFRMQIGNVTHTAVVKEKEEAARIYKEAVTKGRSAGQIETTTRRSDIFKISANVESGGKAVFILTYEELLQRKLDQYEIVINIKPGQIIKNLHADVEIRESRPLKFIRTPALRSGNGISNVTDGLAPEAIVKFHSPEHATTSFWPNPRRQAEYATKLGTSVKQGLSAQFVVQYDIARDVQVADVLVNDGHFVHFFSPDNTPQIPKHAVFVLDVSGSMSGSKIAQLKEAMLSILDKLTPSDLFHIVTFHSHAFVLDADAQNETKVSFTDYEVTYQDMENMFQEISIPLALVANSENIMKAKEMVKNIKAEGSTNTISGLELGLFLINRERKNFEGKAYHLPMIIFLTDGNANAGISNSNTIVKIISRLNEGNQKVPIYSLSFGSHVDKVFLKKLSGKNLGLYQHIYEGVDAAIQLQDFYMEISSPVLRNITFDYKENLVENITKNKFPVYFKGSEMVVAGVCNVQCQPPVPVAWGINGKITYRSLQEPAVVEEGDTLERIWAYLTIRQKLDLMDTVDNNTELAREVMNLAMKYSFVTPMTSLVVVDSSNRTLEGPLVSKADSVSSSGSGSGGGRRGRTRARTSRKYNSLQKTDNITEEKAKDVQNSSGLTVLFKNSSYLLPMMSIYLSIL